MKRITIISGYYGSGKSEISTHLALHKKVDVIVDLDIINPYFRTRALNGLFEQHGIKVIESTIKGMKNSDMPYVSGEAVIPFIKSDVKAIYDLGGTENGGRVLMQFRDRMRSIEEIDLLYVVNIFRPETDSVNKIINSIHLLEGESQLRVTGLINNTNLMEFTTEKDVLEGQSILQEVSKKLHIPIHYTVVEEHHQFNGPFEGELIILKRLVAKEWL
jgi:hypothetical protein